MSDRKKLPIYTLSEASAKAMYEAMGLGHPTVILNTQKSTLKKKLGLTETRKFLFESEFKEKYGKTFAEIGIPDKEIKEVKKTKKELEFEYNLAKQQEKESQQKIEELKQEAEKLKNNRPMIQQEIRQAESDIKTLKKSGDDDSDDKIKELEKKIELLKKSYESDIEKIERNTREANRTIGILRDRLGKNGSVNDSAITPDDIDYDEDEIEEIKSLDKKYIVPVDNENDKTSLYKKKDLEPKHKPNVDVKQTKPSVNKIEKLFSDRHINFAHRKYVHDSASSKYEAHKKKIFFS